MIWGWVFAYFVAGIISLMFTDYMWRHDGIIEQWEIDNVFAIFLITILTWPLILIVMLSIAVVDAFNENIKIKRIKNGFANFLFQFRGKGVSK